MIILERTDKNKNKFDKEFIALHNKMYNINSRTQDNKQLEQILNNRHILSKYVTNRSFLVISGREIVARCMLTYYENDSNAYVGFYESINDTDVARALFLHINNICKNDNKVKIIGPIDMSFWIRYRFRINANTKVPYMCEPYNRSYYGALWEKSGFKVTDEYYSYEMRQVTDKDIDKKCELRYKQSIENGYKYVNITPRIYSKELKNVYTLLTELYSTFPGYKQIEFKEFKELFNSLKYVLNSKMAKLVYKDNQLKAFFICIPDYGNKTYNSTFKNIKGIFYIKKKPKKYVLLYMGVDKTALGLGGALAESIRRELVCNKATSISALIHKDKITGAFYKNCQTCTYKYVLLSKDVI